MPTTEQVFEAAHSHVQHWEGGFFNHPADPGGITNYGISLMFLKSLSLVDADIDGDGDIDADDVRAITPQTARALFRKHFWDAPRLGDLPPLIALITYDLAVNAGTGRAAVVLQQGINQLTPGAIPSLAFNVGPLTRRHSRALAIDGRQLELAEATLDQRAAWYRRLAAAKPSSAVFLKGWLRRTEDCRRLTRVLTKEWSLA